ncbi:MAG: class II aldolase/adducin family protein [Deltaproteobacteria bacterium]|nr:class II aldolase/adducin family protein [Deltaproteobacteria bacterium]
MKEGEMQRLKRDFVAALRIIHRQGLSDAFAHLSARLDGDRMLFMPRKSPALVKTTDLFVVDFEKQVPQSSVHQAIYKVRSDVRAVIHFHSPAVILLTVIGQTVRPLHNYSAIFFEGVPVYQKPGQTETPEKAAEIARDLKAAKAILLRGHGAVVAGQSIPEVCMLSLYLEESARLQAEAMKLGEPIYLSEEEASKIASRTFKPTSTERAWEHFTALLKKEGS